MIKTDPHLMKLVAESSKKAPIYVALVEKNVLSEKGYGAMNITHPDASYVLLPSGKFGYRSVENEMREASVGRYESIPSDAWEQTASLAVSSVYQNLKTKSRKPQSAKEALSLLKTDWNLTLTFYKSWAKQELSNGTQLKADVRERVANRLNERLEAIGFNKFGDEEIYFSSESLEPSIRKTARSKS